MMLLWRKAKKPTKNKQTQTITYYIFLIICCIGIYMVPENRPFNTILTILELPKLTTPKNGPFNIGDVVSRFREVSLYLYACNIQYSL